MEFGIPIRITTRSLGIWSSWSTAKGFGTRLTNAVRAAALYRRSGMRRNAQQGVDHHRRIARYGEHQVSNGSHCIRRHAAPLFLMKNLSGTAQLALLNRAWDLISEANNVLCAAGLGIVRSDTHQEHQGELIYPINDLRSKILDALNAINDQRQCLVAHMRQKIDKDSRW
jgi:hypothetical protein